MRCVLVLIFSLVVAAKCEQRTVENSCPKSLLKRVDKAYLQVEGDLCYRFVTYSEKSYSDANKECIKDGGLLVMPKTKSLNNYLSKELKDTYKMKHPTWIGLHDKNDEGKFRWEDGSILAWKNFASGNGLDRDWMHSAQANAEDCVAIASDGKWHDYQCKSTPISWLSGADIKKPFVCQYPALELPEEQGGDNKEEKTEEEGTNKQENSIDYKGDEEEDEIKEHDKQAVKQDNGEKDEKTEKEDNERKENDDKNINGEKEDQNKENDKKTIKAHEKNEDFETIEADNEKEENDDDNQEEGEEDQNKKSGEEENKDDEHDDGCGPFFCKLDCGMRGYKVDDRLCIKCECN